MIGDYFLEVIEPASVTVGYTFDSDFWHFGYATESFKVLLDILKNEYKFKRVFAHVSSLKPFEPVWTSIFTVCIGDYRGI